MVKVKSVLEKEMEQLQQVVELMKKGEVVQELSLLKIYDKSYTVHEEVRLLMVKSDSRKWIIATGKGLLFNELEGEDIHEEGKACPLTHQNRLVLNRYFAYTVPQAFGKDIATMGLGDRLGLASPGHIETLRSRKIKPILAQQSIRELTLTDRSMHDILDAASFAVFQEGYQDGFGADGDHLKEETDIQHALSLGMSMVTLDCSDHINNPASNASLEEIKQEYSQLSDDMKNHYTNAYLNKIFDINGVSITFDEETLMQYALVYGNAISYMLHIYNSYISKETRAIDFEISIDETETVTSPEAHFFVAKELQANGVKVTSLAPRFCGEFQKGIDYIGDIDQFEKELKDHAAIAEYFDYKLSIHSGSDKFSVFPIISKYTKGLLHVKTAGTNWLEAVRVIARVNPGLYRKMHQFALDKFEEAQKYYHITPDIESISPLETVSDEELVDYLNDDNARQLLHVTYGVLLTAKDENGKFTFKEEFFNTLHEYEDEYREALISHIGKHLDYLNL